MRRILLATLAAAAAALAPAAAAAQRPIVRDGPPPIPDVRIQAPGARAGTTWQAPMRDRGMQDLNQGHHGGFNKYPRYRTIGRGGMLPQYWSGPRYGISNYGMYGFDRPANGSRWVRYYDDALLVDGRGRIQDGRYGMDFDRYGDHWDRDDRGIPVYVGDGDYRPRYRDYAWSDRFERDGNDELAYDRDYPYDHRYGGEGRGGPEGRDEHDYGRGGYGDSSYGRYGQGYSGYGFGGYTVTETVTTTTGPSTVHYVDAPAKKRYAKVKRRYSARKPYRAKSAARCHCT